MPLLNLCRLRARGTRTSRAARDVFLGDRDSRGGRARALRSQAGMTLIEIMIVMAIIGSLMAVLGTTAKTQWEKSKVNNAKILISEVSKAIEQYNMDCNSYPPTLDALLASPGDACPNWGPQPYIKKKNLSDPWGTPLDYQTDGGKFVLKSFGRDKKPDGEGLDKDISNED
jgi:general secretion pathway protein G